MHLPKWQHWVAGFDLHGDMQDPEASGAFLKFVSAFKPHMKIFGGDLFDFRALRRGASAEEKEDSMTQDVATGRKFLTSYRPTVWLKGNHCERLWDLAKHGNGVVGDYAQRGIAELEDLCQKQKMALLPYSKRLGVYQYGDFRFVHGFATGITAARRTALLYGNCIMGHGHQIQMSSVERLDSCVGIMAGCLCRLDFEYNRSQLATLAQEHGWVYGAKSPSGKLVVLQARKVDGTWIIPSL